MSKGIMTEAKFTKAEARSYVVVAPDGAQLAYTVHTADPTHAREALVFLHGNHEDRHVFDGRWEPYVDDYQVVLVDTRWHGCSTSGTEALSYELFARDLALVLDTILAESVTLVGFSDGAITSLLFTLDHPGEVARLVLIGANLEPDAIEPADTRGMQRAYQLASLGAPLLKKWKREKALLGLMLEEPHIDPERLAAITAPALVVTGDRDIILPAHSDLIADSLGNACRIVIPNAKHNVMKHNPEAFDALLSAFLEA